jgi:hypothetical protein
VKVSSSNGSALVSWTPPSTTPDATILWYVIESSSTNPSDPVLKFTADGLTQTSYYIEGLNTNSSYTFKVNAVNCPGYSPQIQTNSIEYINPGIAKLATRCGGTSTDNQGFITLKADSSGNVYQVVPYAANLTIYNYSSAPVGGGEVATSVYGILPLPVSPGYAVYALIKYNSSGQVQWATRIPLANNNIASLTVDNSGNVYYSSHLPMAGGTFNIYNYTSAPVGGGNVGITLYGTLPLNTAVNTTCILKYNSSGSISYATYIWTTTQSSGISVDSSGNAYVAFVNSNKTWGSYLYNFTGAPSPIGGPVNITAYGNIGSAGTPVAAYPGRLVIVKYNTSGIVQWASSVDGINSATDFALSGIAVDNIGGLYVGCYSNDATCTIRSFASVPTPPPAADITFTTWGTITKANTNGGVLLVKYDSTSGSALSATKIETSNASIVGPMYLSCDSSNNVYLSASTNSQFAMSLTFFSYTSGGGGSAVVTTSFGSTDASFGTSWVVKYNSSFAVQWVNKSGGGSSIGGLSSCDNAGNFYMTLSYPNTLGSPVNPPIYNYTSVTGGTINFTQRGVIQGQALGDVFLIRYNSSGAVQWGIRIAGTNEERNSAVALDNNGNVWLSGIYNSSPAVISDFVSLPVSPTGNVTIATYGTLADVDPGSTTRNAFLVKYQI